MKLCPYCQKEHPDEAEFCPTTGQSLRSLSSSYIHCTNCGKNVSSDTKFCPLCGAVNVVRTGENHGIFQVGKQSKGTHIKWVGIGVIIIIFFFAIFSFISGWLPPTMMESTATPSYIQSVSEDPNLAHLTTSETTNIITQTDTLLPPVLTTIPLPYSITPTPERIQWINQLSSNSIIPGVGLAGVELGYTENKINGVLGNLSEIVPIEDVNGNLLSYAIMYKYDGIFLGLYTDKDMHSVRSIRLSDSNFNSSNIIPEIQNITIGSTETQLVQSFGQPVSKDEHFTCPEALGFDRQTTTFNYNGISFWVCEANKLVYLIDIP